MPEPETPSGTGTRAVDSRVPSRLRLSIGRHPRDVGRLVLAAAGFALCAVLSQLAAVNPVEVAVFEQLRALPPVSRPASTMLSWCGSWPGIAVVTVVALYLRRIRLGLECAFAGALAWVLADLAGSRLGTRPVPPDLVDGQASAVLAFPARQVAVAAALLTVLGPYLGRPARTLGWALTGLIGLAVMVLGLNLPLGALGGAALGWGLGTLFHLVWGAPGRRTSGDTVRRELELAGLSPDTVTPVRRHALGPDQFVVRTAGGDALRVSVVRRMHRRAGLLYRVRRLLASLEVQDEPRLSSTRHEVEHDAYVTLLAERAGVRTPPLVLACDTKHGAPLLVRRAVAGRRLVELDPAEIDDDLLAGIWTQIARLGTARIAHHDLCARNILVDADGRPWLLDFALGRAGAELSRCHQDLAEALLSVAALVGVDRAVASAARTLDHDDLGEALQYLHPLALPRRIRRAAGDGRPLLGELREALAERIGRPIPGFRSPIRPSTAIGLVLAGLAVYLLLPQLSSMSQVLGSLRNSDWGWLVVSALTGLVAIALSAVSILGSSHVRLPWWRTMAVQLGAAFTGRTTPGGAGFFGINIAFLERLGLRRSLAVGVTVLNLAGTGLVAVLLCVIGVFGVGLSGVVGGVQIPTGWPVLVGSAAALVLLGVLFGSPFGRRRIVRPGLEVARDLLSTLHHPVRALQLFGGALGYHLMSALGLVTCLAAFQSQFPLLAVITVFLVAQTVGHLAPSPGGLGAVEAAMVAGLTAVGIASTAAVAAVLTSRLLTYWLPVLPGIVMFHYLQHRAVI